MKQRIKGRRNGGMYEVVGIDSSIMTAMPIDEAKSDRKLAAAIKRNGWEPVDG